jgi:hypothetical protein
MPLATIQQLIASRLEDMADQVKLLAEAGYVEEALLLREEGLALAAAYDNEEEFFWAPDFHTI